MSQCVPTAGFRNVVKTRNDVSVVINDVISWNGVAWGFRDAWNRVTGNVFFPKKHYNFGLLFQDINYFQKNIPYASRCLDVRDWKYFAWSLAPINTFCDSE